MTKSTTGPDQPTGSQVTRIGSRDQDPFDCGAAIRSDTMERFVSSFEKSARRWELVVYPAMLAFVVLAAYGFFLIYSLTQDMHTLARSVDPAMGRHLDDMTNSIVMMSTDVRAMTQTLDTMSEQLETLDPMLMNMSSMDQSMRTLSITNDALRHEMTVMGRNISRPMSKMNSMFPW